MTRIPRTARQRTRLATLPGAQRIGVKCQVCGADAWGVSYRTKIVCRVCNPERHGPRAWPRLATVEHKGMSPTIRFSDSARLREGQRALIYRESWGYRVVLQKPPNGSQCGRVSAVPDRGVVELALRR